MSVPVIVYTSTGCPHCVKVKEQLKEWNVAFEERNTSENQEHFLELKERKIFGTPATFIGERFVLGFNPDKMKLHFDNHGIAYGEAAGQVTTAAEEDSAPVTEAPAADEASDTLFQPLTAELLNEVYDFVAIGAGPAGSSAAVYTARGKLKTLVIDKAPTAGTLAITHKIANYPGIRKEMTGLELATEMQQHARDFGAVFVRSTVLSVDFSDPEIKKLHTPEGVIKTKSVFIGVGAKAASSKIEGEEEFTGRGVSYCSTCDAAFFEGRSVIVTGDTEEAVEEAEALSRFSKSVKLLIPTGAVKGGDEQSLHELAGKPNVEIFKKHRIKAIQGEDSVERAVVLDEQKQEQVWETDGVFLYLSGMRPGTAFLQGAVEVDEEGYVIVDDHLRTNVDGVFAGGDARRTPIKQAVVSAADGCIAALAADQHVNKRGKLRPQYS